MIVLGITGSSGSGKSTVAQIIAKELNAYLIVADSIVKEMQKPGNKYYHKIVELFGLAYLNEDGSLNRRKISEIIFNDDEMRNRLNALTNKYVVDKIKKQIKQTKCEFLVMDIPLLFESGLNRECNYIIAVLSDETKQIERICKRDKTTKEDAMARLKKQPNNEFYKEHSDFIIVNEGEDNVRLMGEIRKCLQNLHQM